jgi:hypothetical protein
MRVYESITQYTHVDGRQVRVWRAEKSAAKAKDSFIEAVTSTFAMHVHQDLRTIAEALARLDGVAAVEAKGPDGNGLVIYTEWP